MITFLHGILEQKEPTRCVINVQGVGYELPIPLSSFDQLPQEGLETKLFTHFHVREDAQILFGFASEEERSCFLLLLGVNGIGPRIALSALSSMTPKDIKTALVSGDAKRLSTISGVGKKTAERMVVELRDKLDDADTLLAGQSGSDEKEASGSMDAIRALTALGFKLEDARKKIQAIPNYRQLKTEELIRRALSG